MIHHFSGWMNKKKQKRHTFMYLYLLSMCIYAWVWIVACTPRHMLFFSFLFSIVCVCVCTLHTVCVCLHVPDGERGEEMAEGEPTTLSEACNVLGFGIPLARVYGKTNKKGGGFASKHMSRCEAVWPWLSWLLFQLSLTFKAVLKAAVHSCILFITMASKWITFPLSVLQMRKKDSRLLSE